MVQTKHCAHGTCNSDSRYSHHPHRTNVTFTRFPDPVKFRAKCKKCVVACKRVNFSLVNVTSNSFMCPKHFVGGNGPTQENPDPISATLSQEKTDKLTRCKRKAPKEPVNIFGENKRTRLNETEPVSECSSTQPSLITVADFSASPGVSVSNQTSLPPDEDIVDHNDSQGNYEPDINSQSWHNISLLMMKQFLVCGWHFSCNDDFKQLLFVLVNKHTITKSVIFDTVSGGCAITILGRSVDLNLLNVQGGVFSVDNLATLLCKVYDCCMCRGNQGIYFNCNSDLLSSDMTICHQTQALRATQCESIAANGIRCAHCDEIRPKLRKRIIRRSNAKKKLNAMDKQRLISANNLQRKELLLSTAKLIRCQARVKKPISNGHEVSSEDNTLFADILEEHSSSAKSETLRLMIREQLKAAKHPNSKSFCWNPTVLKWCVYIFQKSPSAYDAIRSSGFLQLPSKRTLNRSLVNFRHPPGIHDYVLKDMVIHSQINSKPRHCSYVSLIFDEMRIKSSLVYEKHSGNIIGFVDVDKTIEDVKKVCDDALPPIATHMPAFFVRSVTSDFKYAFAHFPTAKPTADVLYRRVWEAIEKLEEYGFRVLTLVGDGATVNRKVFKMCASTNLDDDIPFQCDNPFTDESRKIYFISDAPHLLKTLRNCLANSNIKCKPRRMWRNGFDIVWAHIIQLYKTSISQEYRLTWRVKHEHVFLTPFSKMNVSTAARILSNGTAAALELVVKEKATETIKFIKMVNDWFDCGYVRNLHTGIRKTNKFLLPYKSENDWRLKWLKDTFLHHFSTWKTEIQQRPGEFSSVERDRMFISEETFRGLQMTVNSLIEVIPFLLKNGAKFVLTGNLNQDILEQEFSRQRYIQGCNENPTVQQYSQGAKKLNCLRKYVKTPLTGNTQVQE